MTQNMPELIAVTGRQEASVAWRPVQGEEASRLLERMRRISAEEKEQILREAAATLAQGPAPGHNGATKTVLVVGYVQSGKTASFTTVAALARDNNYQLVIVITGISTSLLRQSGNRLLRDLGVDERDDRKWRWLQNPALRGNTRVSQAEIRDTLDAWTDPLVPDPQRQALLITVMKNHRHLRNLTAVLQGLDLSGVPTLVIDDEADQAGLNTKVNEGEQSPTYRHILALREVLPSHTYLQYTATPQAPLLISLADALSPDFVRVLSPGADYVGGSVFFEERRDLISIIPTSDIISSENELTSPPASLQEALRLFFLGVAAGFITDEGRGNRSMLVHPSQGTLQHKVYLQWVNAIRNTWVSLLELPETDRDRRELLAEFDNDYAELARSVGAALPDSQAVAARLGTAMKRTRVLEVNASVGGKTPEIRWQDAYSHILVGGQAMDRGFTVEGLTVTYMPRGTGVGNADTIQQRARFLGYKRGILGYCRVFLEEDTVSAFRGYVRHERHMRAELEKQAASGAPLSSWKRRFFIDPAMKATRDEVIGLDSMRFNFITNWFRPKVVYDSVTARTANQQLVERFEGALELVAQRDMGGEAHLVATGVPIGSVIGELLSEYRVGAGDDSWRLTALILQLQRLAEDTPHATCTVYVMGRARDRAFQRHRPVDPESQVLLTTLFQGRNAAGYTGDSKLPTHSGDSVQLQIHHLSLRQGTADGAELASNVVVITARISAEDEVIVQA